MADPIEEIAAKVVEVAEAAMEFYDFDAAMGEIEKRPFGFTYGAENYVVDMNVDAGKMLLFMEESGSLKSIPILLQCFLSDEQYQAIKDTKGVPFQEMELLISKFAEELGSGSGN